MSRIVFVARAAVAIGLAGAAPSDSPAAQGDVVATARRSWVHELAHWRSAQDFAGGELVRARQGGANGPSLAPKAQPANSEDDGSASYTSRSIAPKQSFHELTASWNIDVPDGSGFWFEVRVARGAEDAWTPWLRLGQWGEGLPEWTPVLRIADGRVESDRFVSPIAWDRAEFRVVAWLGRAHEPELRISRVDLTFSTRDALPSPRSANWKPLYEGAWRTHFDVPFRGERDLGRDCLSNRSAIAAASMVAEFHGARRSASELASRAAFAAQDALGGAPRIVQAAFELGSAGYCARFGDWDEVQRSIAVGEPLVIRLPTKPGEAAGLADGAASERVFVLAGFDDADQPCIVDPLAADATSAHRTMTRAQLEAEWLERGGDALVLLPKK